MRAKFIHDGTQIDYRPATPVAAGDLVVLGKNLVGIALRDIPSGTLGSVATAGVFEVDCASTALSTGRLACTDGSNRVSDESEMPEVYYAVGVAISDAVEQSDGTYRILVRLNHPSFRTAWEITSLSNPS